MGACVQDLEGALGKIFLRGFPFVLLQGWSAEGRGGPGGSKGG